MRWRCTQYYVIAYCGSTPIDNRCVYMAHVCYNVCCSACGNMCCVLAVVYRPLLKIEFLAFE